MRTTNNVVSVLLAAGVVVGVPVALPGAGAKGKPRSFKVEGEILTMAPVTHNEFIGTCPTLPKTQGLGAHVVEVPDEFRSRPARATVESTAAASLDPGIDLSFYSSTCDQLELFKSPPVSVPPGTGYIVVEDIRGVGIKFGLTLTQR